jgi:chloramphenicol 3-O-phosphotransferase
MRRAINILAPAGHHPAVASRAALTKNTRQLDGREFLLLGVGDATEPEEREV